MVPVEETIEFINDNNLINAQVPDNWRPLWEKITFEQRECIIVIPSYELGILNPVEGVFKVDDPEYAIVLSVEKDGQVTVYLIMPDGDSESRVLF